MKGLSCCAKVTRLDNEVKIADHLYASTVVSGRNSSASVALIQQEMLNGRNQRVRVVEQDSVSLNKTLPDMLRHARAKGLANLAVIQRLPQFRNGRDSQLFKDTQHPSRIESRMLIDRHDLRRHLCPKLFKTAQPAFQHNLAHSKRDRFADPFIGRQVPFIAHQFVHAFAEASNRRGCPAVGPNLIGILTFDSEKLRQ